MTTQELGALVKTDEGLVSRKIFWNEDIYRLELERIFTRCWPMMTWSFSQPELKGWIQAWFTRCSRHREFAVS